MHLANFEKPLVYAVHIKRRKTNELGHVATLKNEKTQFGFWFVLFLLVIYKS